MDDKITTAQHCIYTMAGKVFKNERNMNKLTDITIIYRSVKNTATVHMRDRCRALEERKQQ